MRRVHLAGNSMGGTIAQVLPGIGHFPMVEAPQTTAQTYTRFLKELPQRP